MLSLFEWLGALTGILGSVCLASKSRYSKYGFVWYLLSNMCWIIYAYSTSTWGLLIMQFGFTAVSVYGVIRWFGHSPSKQSLEPIVLPLHFGR